MVVVPIANTWGFVVLQNESPWMPCAMVNTLKLCWCLSVPNVSFIFWRSLKAGVPWGFLYFVFVCPIDVTFLQLAVPRVDVTFAQLMWFLNPLLLGTISYVSIALLGTVPPTDQWFHVFRLFAIPTMVILECPLGWPHRLIHFFWIIRAGVVPESLAPNGAFQQKHLVSTFKSAAQTWGMEHWDAKYHVAKGILRKMEDEKGLVWGLWINVVNRLYNKPTMWEWFIQPIHGYFWWFWGWFIIGFTTF